MAFRKRKHTEITTLEERKKAQVRVVYFQVYLVNHLYNYFADCKGRVWSGGRVVQATDKCRTSKFVTQNSHHLGGPGFEPITRQKAHTSLCCL